MKKSLFLGICLSISNIVNVSAQLPSFADLAETLLPSVVNISTTGTNEDNVINISPETETLGSGFIISKDGYIVTNQHVIDKAETISITLHNNEKVEAEIIGEDKKTDLAVLKISSQNQLSPVTFGNSDTMRVGDWILAIGNPFGLGGSVTAGIISAKSRDIESGSYDNFIQTDAAINQGNSGGPMFNLQGEVIGINSAIFSSTGESMGIGFATPSKMAEWVISQLIKEGKVTRGWIGISIKPAHHPDQGILVSRVNDNSPAQKSGFNAGDIITKFNNSPVTSTTNLSRIIAESAIGETLNFEIIRDSKTINLKVTTIEMPEENNTNITNQPPSQISTSDKNTNISGLEINNISEELLTKYNLPHNSKGVIVTSIDNLSDAASKGIKEGNLITHVDKKEVFDTISFLDYIKVAQNENNRPILLTIQDAHTEHFVAIKLK